MQSVVFAFLVLCQDKESIQSSLKSKRLIAGSFINGGMLVKCIALQDAVSHTVLLMHVLANMY